MSHSLRILNLPVNLNKLRKDFVNLTRDPYIKEGYRWKHIVRFQLTDSGLVKSVHGPLFQSASYNPVHGNISREYPEYKPNEESMKIINDFVKLSSPKLGDEILVQAQRVTCKKNFIGLPSVEDWHRDGVHIVGVFSVSRNQVRGGISEFRDEEKKLFFSKILEPGYLALFEDAKMEHRVTPIEVEKGFEFGFRDVMLLAHPANRK